MLTSLLLGNCGLVNSDQFCELLLGEPMYLTVELHLLDDIVSFLAVGFWYVAKEGYDFRKVGNIWDAVVEFPYGDS